MFKASNKDNVGAVTSPLTIIAAGMDLVGDMNCTGDIKIDGNVSGDIACAGRVIIGKQGKITGTLRAKTVMIQGAFEGRLVCSGVLSLKVPAIAKGEIMYDKIEIEHGVLLQGQLSRIVEKSKTKPIAKNGTFMEQGKGRTTPLQVIKVKNRERVFSDNDNDQMSGLENTGWG